MLYFIPAWYLKNEWKENEQLWHIRRTQTETDDTVKQVQLFQRNHICGYEILLLSQGVSKSEAGGRYRKPSPVILLFPFSCNSWSMDIPWSPI